MDLALGALIFVVGAGLAAFVVWRITSKNVTSKESQIREIQAVLGETNVKLATATERATRTDELEAQLVEAQKYRENWQIAEGKISALEAKIVERENAHENRLADLKKAEEDMLRAFEALAADAMSKSQKSFLDLATQKFLTVKSESVADLDARKVAIENLVKPINERLVDLSQKTAELEKNRVASFENMRNTLSELREDQKLLRSETGKLSSVLRNPKQRGYWGEIELKRIIELAGMVERCDFFTEVSQTGEGGKVRPDVVVKLPNNRSIIIDSKAPMDAYTQSVEATNEAERAERMDHFAKTVKSHLTSLKKKNYDKVISESADLIVMFLPLESMFSAAVEQDPSLLDFGAEQGVLIATPVTLIALLRAVAIGWRQEDLARNAQEVAKVGNALYDGLQTFMEHYVKLGKNLDTAITAYNASVGSVERSVLSRARKLKVLYNKQEGIKTPPDIDQMIRPLAVVQASEEVVDIEEEVEPDALPAPTLDLD